MKQRPSTAEFGSKFLMKITQTKSKFKKNKNSKESEIKIIS